MFKYLLAAVVAFQLLPNVGSASPRGFLYDCNVAHKTANQGWISQKVAIVVGRDGKVSILDEVIMNFEVNPVVASVTRDTDNAFHLSWTVRNARDHKKTLIRKFDYTATINKATQRIKMTAKPRTYDDRFSSNGTCQVRVG
ncbi:MAG: hypothetical protein WBC93_15830 [Sulfitobacter sp.]